MQDGEGFAQGMFVLQTGQKFFAPWVVAQKQGGGFREGTLEVNVARETIILAGRLTATLHQAAIRDNLLDTGEAGNIVNLIEDLQS